MPYIKRDLRLLIDPLIGPLLQMNGHPIKAGLGGLNYVITRILVSVWQANPSYHRAVEIMGTLECVKQEFYRRAVVPYETEKMAQEGDVF